MKWFALAIAAVAICTIAAQDATAASDVGLKGVGAKFGVVNPDDMDATAGFGAFVDLGTVDRVRLIPYLDYWSQNETSPGTETTFSDLTLGMRGHYEFPVNSSFQPYAGLGLGIHVMNSEFTSGTTVVDDSATELGMDIGGGVLTDLSPRFGILGELWYGFVSEANQFSARVGVEYRLGK